MRKPPFSLVRAKTIGNHQFSIKSSTVKMTSLRPKLHTQERVVLFYNESTDAHRPVFLVVF